MEKARECRVGNLNESIDEDVCKRSVLGQSFKLFEFMFQTEYSVKNQTLSKTR